MSLRLPSPPASYERSWANQYSRILEQEDQTVQSNLQQLRLFVAPNYTTAQKNSLTVVVGSVVFDTDLDKLCVLTSGGWETITSAP